MAFWRPPAAARLNEVSAPCASAGRRMRASRTAPTACTSTRGPPGRPTARTTPRNSGQGGFRLDWNMGREKADKITFQGDYYSGNAQNAAIEPVFSAPPFEQMVKTTLPMEGGNLLTRWTHTVDEDSDYSLQIYYDRLGSSIPTLGLGQDTFDLDFTDRFALTDRQKIIWGGGYRFTGESFQNTPITSIEPSSVRLNLFSAFFQDEIAIIPEKLAFTAGFKLEHNDFTGFECQPSLRLLWMLNKKSSAWGAVSRAVRTPDVWEYYGTSIGLPVAPGVPLFPVTTANPNIISESLMAYELGYRVQATDKFSWDVALFYNQYDSIVTYSPGLMTSSFLPRSGQQRRGRRHLRLRVVLSVAGFQSLETPRLLCVPGNATPRRSRHDNAGGGQPGTSPQNQISLMSSWDLGSNVEFDMMARYVDALTVAQVPEYIDMDLRLAWRPRKHLELEVVGQNLLSNHVLQFNDQTPSIDLPTEIPRGVYGKVTWQY